MSFDPAIRVCALSKCFRIYEQPKDRLKESLFRLVARFIPFPNTRHRLQRLADTCARNFWALQDVSFEVAAGETVGIIGHNGSGKSTLLQLICNTLNATHGEIVVRGRIAALLELGAGFNPEFSGRENVFLNGQLLGLTRTEIAERFDAIAAFADIGDFIDQPVKSYSSGMYVRLAFAVIAHVDADILVIDEALAVGDAYFTQKCMRFLHRFMERGTVLFVSHDIASVKALARRSIWLEDGKIKMIGETREIADRYLQALYAKAQDITATEIPPAGDDPRSGADEGLPEAPIEDYRIEIFQESGVSNRLRASRFDPNAAGFGDGKARIRQVRIRNKYGKIVFGIRGGERLTLEIEIEAIAPLEAPIVGFFLRNRLGQNVFGDNSFFATQNAPLVCPSGRRLLCQFEFVMPFLPRGDYAFSVAVATGNNQEHIQHQWLHDALMIKSLSSDVHADVLGIPMANISLDILALPDEMQ